MYAQNCFVLQAGFGHPIHPEPALPRPLALPALRPLPFHAQEDMARVQQWPLRRERRLWCWRLSSTTARTSALRQVHAHALDSKRRGAGRIRHLHTPLLWVQQKRLKKDIEIRKTPGETNPADLGTKDLSRVTMDKHLATCGFTFVSGKHPKALSAQISGPGEVGGLSGCGGDLAPRSEAVPPSSTRRCILSGAWGGRVGAPAGRGPHAPLPECSERAV